MFVIMDRVLELWLQINSCFSTASWVLCDLGQVTCHSDIYIYIFVVVVKSIYYSLYGEALRISKLLKEYRDGLGYC